ncbi:MAG: hypothetical protein K6T91_04170 [Firmicutes bacterium]|nr:hypothetical protein [Bacillota bacterium]
MDKHEFLKTWENYSGLRLIGDEREKFLEECGLILYLDDDILEMSLKVAAQKHNFDLQYIETVGLHLRQYLHRVRYEALDGERVDDEDSQAPRRRKSTSRKKRHLTLLYGGEAG